MASTREPRAVQLHGAAMADDRQGVGRRDHGGARTYLHPPEGDVAVAERGADDLDPDLVSSGRVHDHLLHGERLAGGPAHGRWSAARTHGIISPCMARAGEKAEQ